MRILHTSDWHLGKRLQNKNRLCEQKEVLAEITDIVIDEKVDVVLVAGDVFDTFVPPSEAEELFYESVLAISKYATVIVIAGNHDDATRLSAPIGLAKASGILLCGDENLVGYYSNVNGVIVEGGDGFVRVSKNGETLNLGLLSFPTTGKLLDMAGEVDFCEYVSQKAQKSASAFVDGQINMFISHLFVMGGESFVTDERELGGTKLLPRQILQLNKCSYIGLGHVHKPLTLSKEHNIYYSGSLLRYSFDDTSDKRVILFESDGKKESVTSIPLKSGKKLLKITVNSVAEALQALDDNANDYVYIVYDSVQPITPKDMATMKRSEAYCGINVVKKRETSERERKGKSDKELFEMFYEQKRNEKPSEEIVEMFLRAVNNEEI
ncbi:MAG: exonuclease SbcCD subunit D [Clostridia bacterium]|nr:exonuclease SbcCD subunit D [Clostridia bacterium]